MLGQNEWGSFIGAACHKDLDDLWSYVGVFLSRNWTETWSAKVQQLCSFLKLYLILVFFILIEYISFIHPLYKNLLAWFLSRLGGVSSPPCCSAAGWQRTPAVREVQGKYFDFAHHTHPSISLSNPPPAIQHVPAQCVKEGLQLREQPASQLWRNQEEWTWKWTKMTSSRSLAEEGT